MIYPHDAWSRYGDPEKDERKFMVLYDVPTSLEIGVIPKKVYCNKDVVAPLSHAFCLLNMRGYVDELKTWDGCFNIRPVRGYEASYKRFRDAGDIHGAISLLSLHAWGLAVDVNAAWNGLGKAPTLSNGFVQCWLDAGWDWGGFWKRKDGMHFQLKSLPS